MNIRIIAMLHISMVSSCAELQIKSLKELLPSHPEIEYIKCHEAQPFHYQPFPIARFPELQPHEGLFAESFILKIPNGRVFSTHGFINVADHFVRDFMPPYWSLTTQIDKIKSMTHNKIRKISGRVAVITMLWDDNYFHWIANILSRLALLEEQNIEYDWLYVACDKPYMKETLTLWGIDISKVIQPFGDTKYIVADELIVPSHPGQRSPLAHQYTLDWIPLEYYCKLYNMPHLSVSGNDPNKSVIIPDHIAVQDFFMSRTPLCSAYFPTYTLEHLRAKFLSFMQHNERTFSKKVFISRADSQWRKIINEDKVFKLFEEQGFSRYVLSSLSISEQIALFHGADIIVAAHGAGLINLLCCKPGTTVIELFQARSDSCFYYLSQLLGLNHHCIQTMDFENIEEFKNDSIIPLFIVQEVIDTLLKISEVA